MEQLSIEQIQKELPQLIVALDSLSDSANYIHVADAKDDVIYYCPCCKGVIKPRAYKTDIEYQVQPHFYHENGGCNEESFVHYICKTWLFERGSKFKIDNIIYTVSNIETEKSLSTEFGSYKPDIIVYTDENKTFFFEIKYSNKKTEHYIPKWDELGNDVVEVDARYFINQKFVNDIPEFKLIYSDGECYIKSYTKSDYDDFIAKRKLEWKRQDKLNYKIMWERLDWFWNELQKFKQNSDETQQILSSFALIDISDKELIFDLIKKQTCIKRYSQDFRDIINKEIKVFCMHHSLLNFFNDKTISINNVACSVQEGVQISISLDCLLWNHKKYHHLSESFYSKEWILRYSKLKEILDSLKSKTIIARKNEHSQKALFCEVTHILHDIKEIYFKNQTIWELDYNEYKLQNIDCCEQIRHDIHIGIKNGYSYFHNKNIEIHTKELENLNLYGIQGLIIQKLEKTMNEIYTFVKNCDGQGCEYRHMFKSNELEVINDK